MFGYLRALWVRGEDIGREATWAAALLCGLTAIVIAIELIFRPGVGWCIAISTPIWIYSATRIFSVRRYIEVHIGGEALEFIKAIPNQPGVLTNQLADSYWRTISNLFLLQTVLFLGLPLYVNYTKAGAAYAVIIVMIGVALALAEWKVFQIAFRYATIAVIICMVVGVLMAMFPQLRFYTGADKYLSKAIPGSTAGKVAEIDRLRRKQREAKWNKLLDEAHQWQKNNPGEELPQNHKDVIEAAGKGITLEQLTEERARKAEEIKRVTSTSAAPIATCQPNPEVGVYCAKIQPGGFDSVTLPTGEYALSPKTAQTEENGHRKNSGGSLSAKKSGEYFFYLPGMESGEITITKKPPS